VGIFAHQMLKSHALTLTSATHAGWIAGLIPIWSAVLAAIFLGERFGWMKITGLLIGFAGATLVTTRGDLSPRALALPATRGDLLLLASSVSWAVYTILSRDPVRRLGAAPATAGSMLLGWALFIPFFIAARGWREYGLLSAAGWGAVLFLGIGCSGIGYLCWYGALRRLDASRVSSFLYIEPLITLAAAAWVLGEPVERPAVVGGLLVLAGVFIVERAPAAP
jgi:drug/metabolite transporter (DMT)-like permease